MTVSGSLDTIIVIPTYADAAVAWVYTGPNGDTFCVDGWMEGRRVRGSW